ncbi:Vasohibin-domain-containing protein [Haematococcus lacustris]
MASAFDELQAMLGALPLTPEQELNLARLVPECSTEQLASLGLAAPPRPTVPKSAVLAALDVAQRLEAVQRVINALEYNHQQGYLFNVDKDRPLCRILDTARDVLREAMPIKCIEAVFLGLLLTNNWEHMERYPVGFKSKCQGNTYRHIVLAVRDASSGLWGALGISRREELMFKPLAYHSLAALMLEFKVSYEKWHHTLHKIRVGLPVEHGCSASGGVCWRYCNVSAARHPWSVCASVLDCFAGSANILAARFSGSAPPKSSRSAGQPATRPSAATTAASLSSSAVISTVHPKPHPPSAASSTTSSSSSSRAGPQGHSQQHHHHLPGHAVPRPCGTTPEPGQQRSGPPPSSLTHSWAGHSLRASSTSPVRGQGAPALPHSTPAGLALPGPTPAPASKTLQPSAAGAGFDSPSRCSSGAHVGALGGSRAGGGRVAASAPPRPRPPAAPVIAGGGQGHGALSTAARALLRADSKQAGRAGLAKQGVTAGTQ